MTLSNEGKLDIPFWCNRVLEIAHVASAKVGISAGCKVGSGFMLAVEDIVTFRLLVPKAHCRGL